MKTIINYVNGLFNFKNKKRKDKGLTIGPGESMEGHFSIPINSFPEEIRDLMIDPVKNKEEIIKRVGPDKLFVELEFDYEDDSGNLYRQKWVLNIITGDVKPIDETNFRINKFGLKK